MTTALEKSIAHWIEIRDGVECLLNCSGDWCALCELYAGEGECVNCPLRLANDKCGGLFTNSTWFKYNSEMHKIVFSSKLTSSTMSTITPEQKAILYPLADAMVKKLEGLR